LLNNDSIKTPRIIIYIKMVTISRLNFVRIYIYIYIYICYYIKKFYLLFTPFRNSRLKTIRIRLAQAKCIFRGCLRQKQLSPWFKGYTTAATYIYSDKLFALANLSYLVYSTLQYSRCNRILSLKMFFQEI